MNSRPRLMTVLGTPPRPNKGHVRSALSPTDVGKRVHVSRRVGYALIKKHHILNMAETDNSTENPNISPFYKWQVNKTTHSKFCVLQKPRLTTGPLIPVIPPS